MSRPAATPGSRWISRKSAAARSGWPCAAYRSAARTRASTSSGTAAIARSYDASASATRPSITSDCS